MKKDNHSSSYHVFPNVMKSWKASTAVSYPTNPTRGHATGIIERNTFHLRSAASSSSNLEAGVTKALISGPLPLLVLVLELPPLLLLPMPLLLLAIAIVARLGLGR